MHSSDRCSVAGVSSAHPAHSVCPHQDLDLLQGLLRAESLDDVFPVLAALHAVELGQQAGAGVGDSKEGGVVSMQTLDSSAGFVFGRSRAWIMENAGFRDLCLSSPLQLYRNHLRRLASAKEAATLYQRLCPAAGAFPSLAQLSALRTATCSALSSLGSAPGASTLAQSLLTARSASASPHHLQSPSPQQLQGSSPSSPDNPSPNMGTAGASPFNSPGARPMRPPSTTPAVPAAHHSAPPHTPRTPRTPKHPQSYLAVVQLRTLEQLTGDTPTVGNRLSAILCRSTGEHSDQRLRWT